MPAAFSVPEPSTVAPSENVTSPPGVPPLLPTVAVKTTCAPWPAGFSDVASVMCDEARFVTSDTGCELAEASAASPA